MSATLVTPKTTSGGEIIRELVNASDGAGLHLDAGGTITLANAAAAEFGTSDFSLEFVLNRTANNTNNNVIYESHSSGNNRITLKALTGGDLVATFTNSSGVNADYNTGYDINVDLNTVTHYALTFDRSGDLTVYKNGNSVATISIAASSSVDIGASNTNTGRIGYVTTYGVIGTFYRFRAFNTLADAKLLFERADVPQTLTANLLFDLDLAFANPTQSLTVQDRAGAADGTASASGVTQVQPVVQLNSTSARIGTSAATPADGDIVADKIGVGVAPSTLADFKANSTNGATIKLINSDYNNTNEFTAGIGNLDIFANTTTVLGAAYRYLRLGVGTTESIRIDSTGDVTVNESLAIGTSPTSGISLNVRENSTTTAADIRNANASGFGLYVAGGSSSSEYAFRAANKDNTALFTVRGDGLAEFSNGINLGDTTLSNYEQGNFTLTDASGAGLTITGGLGFYTRIGNTVHVTVQFTMPTTSNSSTMKLSGLPYAVPNDNDYRGLVLNYSNRTGVEYALSLYNSDDIDFYTDAGASATNADGSGGGFYINGHYKV